MYVSLSINYEDNIILQLRRISLNIRNTICSTNSTGTLSTQQQWTAVIDYFAIYCIGSNVEPSV